MITATKLRYFLAIVDAGSLSAAAAAFDVSQPPLSQQRAALERHLGQRLQVLWNRLVFITDQADLALGRTVFSPIVRETRDFVTVLMDTDGNALAQCTLAIPVFITW